LSKKTENIIKGLRKDLNDTLGEYSPEYKNANTKYSETIQTLKNIQDIVGKKTDLNGPNVSKALGGTMRKLLSNYGSRTKLIDTLEIVNNVVNKYGFKSKDDLIKQTIFANELDRKFGGAPAGFKEQVGQGVKRGVDFVRQSNTGKALALAENIINKSRGRSEEKAIKALYDILKKDYTPR
jgi:hypothetical protein